MDPSTGPKKRPNRVVRAAENARTMGAATAIPSMILIGLLGGYFLGAWLERRYGHAPWLSFGGLVLGGVVSVRKVVEVLRQEQRRARAADESKKPRRNP